MNLVSCRPLFKLPPGFRTTRRPFRSDNPARSSTPQPITTTRPPVTILRTNTAGDFTTSSIRINNRGRKIDAGPKFNSFTTEMPNYGQQQPEVSPTTPETTEIYQFFGGKSTDFDVLDTTVSKNAKNITKTLPAISYSTVIVHSPSPKPKIGFSSDDTSGARTTRLAGFTTPIPFFNRPNDRFNRIGTTTNPTTTDKRNNDKILTRKNDKFCKNCEDDEVDEDKDSHSSSSSEASYDYDSLPWPFTPPKADVYLPGFPVAESTIVGPLTTTGRSTSSTTDEYDNDRLDLDKGVSQSRLVL